MTENRNGRSKHRKLCNKVPRLEIAEIRQLAHGVRDILSSFPRFNKTEVPIAELLDRLRDTGQIEFQLVEQHELPNEYAVSYPDKKCIKCRETVYNNALAGQARDRFTLAHELGHILLHQNINPMFARSQSVSFHHFTEDAEWQANAFASEFLVDSRMVESSMTPRDISKLFGVSFEAAGYIYDRFKKENLI
ncbi:MULTISPECIES: ImmA/IrrE family metallo-endopeptidase [Shewanella]|uniref:ImmA/IrrE family metallo-endopeptidase n=1 Tax=Shewanella TaxID=22 RepID=UPI00118684E8|nr:MULTISPECIES: ImmA/IrrE family metallo-endopeptidase [Shewanella]MBO2631464.1 ImmA/IrrE family metallo-endopeptidase [Shewanella algae]MCE9787685.1 ImmA/IrrE family metallo-endopeptidase [Shewanella chilikensis]QNV04198.1 ImmA/IrrE family metallo-endopeptidase [Shewanella algae]TVP12980.1 hypothetical protein AYI96_03940 [Shewanella sp. MSW]